MGRTPSLTRVPFEFPEPEEHVAPPVQASARKAAPPRPPEPLRVSVPAGIAVAMERRREIGELSDYLVTTLVTTW